MPKAKYYSIYRDLKEKIENDEYEYQGIFPSENTLVQQYDCSRNTIRRAVAELVADGYVQTSQGKGVRVIYQPREQTSFTIGSIESFQESARRNHRDGYTRVLWFAELTADRKIEKRTGFPVGTELYYIQRLHYLDGVPLILNHNYFLKELVPGLTAEIASGSIYRYLEEELHLSIITSKRVFTVELMTEIDEKYLNIKDYNCLAVVSSHTFNDDGVMFEFTQSRHHPEYFRFQDTAVRRPF